MHNGSFRPHPSEGGPRSSKPGPERPELRVLRPYSDAAKDWAERQAENLRGYVPENELIMNLESALKGTRADAEREREKAAEERRRAADERTNGKPNAAKAREERAADLEGNAGVLDDKANAMEAVLAAEEAKWQKFMDGSSDPEEPRP